MSEIIIIRGIQEPIMMVGGVLQRFTVCTLLALALCASHVLGTTIAIYGAEPSSLMNATGDSYETWTGVEADIIRHLCGAGYLQDCTFFKVYDLEGRIEALVNGSADVSISGIAVTEDKAKVAQFIHPYYFDVGLAREDLPSLTGEPMGAMVALDAPDYLVTSLQAGISSLFEDGPDSLILRYADANLDEPGLTPGGGSIVSQVEAISSFITPLNISDGDVVSVDAGSLPGVVEGDQFNVTIAIWTENLPPLADLQGSTTFLEEGSSWSGIEMSLLRAFCSREAITCNQNLVEVQTLDDRLNVVENGTADISVGAITVTTDRLGQVPFVRPFYYSSGLGLFTNDENYEKYSGETDPSFLSGENVCSQEGAAWSTYLEQYGATVVTVATEEAAATAISNGECIAFAYDSFYYISGLKELPLFLPETQLPYGIAVSQDIPRGLLSELTSTVVDGLSDGSDSFLLKSQEEQVKAFNTVQNPNLQNVTDIITNLSVTPQDAVSKPPAGGDSPEESTADSPASPAPEQSPAVEEGESESSSATERMAIGRVVVSACASVVAFLVFTVY